MREDICSIPINDMFTPKCGCPICRMYETIEKRMLEYIMGSAMMEPDVRVETNRIGFCHKHYTKMFEGHGKLQLALILQTHINEFDLDNNKKLADRVKTVDESCFVCEKIEWGFSRLISQIFHMYETDEEFRALFNSQPQFCLKHYKLLNDKASKKNLKKHYKEFSDNLFSITQNTLKEVEKNIKLFTKMYDYNSDKNSPEFDDCKEAVEDALWFVTSKNFKK